MNFSPEEILVFLGPSLALGDAQSTLKATYVPPAKQGDILSAANWKDLKVIALIDGFFLQKLSVWHKEILYALDRGIFVLGSSSMGALRAAETADFGMIGVGKIYELYKNGSIIDDDEVVLAHGPAEEGYFPLSIPLINLRFTLDLAAREKAFSPEICSVFFKIAQSLYYPERTFEQIKETAEKQGHAKKETEEVIAFLQTRYIDQKKEDALLLLDTIKTLDPAALPSKKPFMRTSLFEVFYHYDQRVRTTPAEVSTKQIALHFALHDPHFPDTQYHAFNQVLVNFLADILKLEVTEEAIQQEKERLYFRLKLTAEKDQKEWILRNHLKPEEFHQLLSDRCKARALHHSILGSQVPWKRVKYLLDALKMSNRYEECVEKASIQEEFVQHSMPHYSEGNLAEMQSQEIIESHAMQTPWNPDVSCPSWAKDAGFYSVSEMKTEMIKAKIARDFLESLASFD
ncbi:MAG: TfuA-like protein [Chlamydiota bacterium]